MTNVTDEKAARIVTLYKRGWAAQKIAAALDVTADTVRAVLASPPEPAATVDVSHDIAARREPVVEVLAVRDPDNGTDVTVWIDGVQVKDRTLTVDAGLGYDRAGWDSETEHVRNLPGLSDAFRAAVLAARADPPGARYIEDDPED